jgi:hypothetical protein
MGNSGERLTCPLVWYKGFTPNLAPWMNHTQIMAYREDTEGDNRAAHQR